MKSKETDSDGEYIENECTNYGEDYNQTKHMDDWIKCVSCSLWLHEGLFSIYKSMSFMW